MDFTQQVDLASESLGGRVIAASDEFFAPKENLLKPSKPVFLEDKYTDRGKWMDGWETRRRRSPGYDWAIIQLGLPGVIRGIVVDTSHFKGNFPESCRLEGFHFKEVDPPPWAEPGPSKAAYYPFVELLAKSSLKGDSQNRFAIKNPRRFTHVRFSIFPDGGVARLRVYGEVRPDWPALLFRSRQVDLAAMKNGGLVVESSDMFFGSRHNLILPGPALNMGDGWETRRRRGPGHDWVVIRLGRTGIIRRVEVDTTFYKGNYPESCSLEGRKGKGPWREILPRTPLRADLRQQFSEVQEIGPVTHVRFNIFPDGGVGRLRLYGMPM